MGDAQGNDVGTTRDVTKGTGGVSWRDAKE